MKEATVNWMCKNCGTSSTKAATVDKAIELAESEGFMFRQGPKGRMFALCPDCASVKQMNTTSAQYYKDKNVGKV